MLCNTSRHISRVTLTPHSLTSHITVTTFSPWPWVWQRPGSSTWSRDVGECGRPGLASHSGPLLTCSGSAFAMSQSEAVFSLFYGPIVHLSQQLTHCLCVARLLAHCLLKVRARALSSLMKCFVTGNSAVNVLSAGPESRLPSSARPDSALAACV